jgi:integrase
MTKALVERPEQIAYLTPEEWGRLLKVIKDPRDKAIFTTAYTYGLRASEVGLIRLADVDFARDRIYIHRLKGSISGEWPLLPDVERALKRWLKARQKAGLGNKTFLFVTNRGTSIHRSTLHLLMRKYGEKADIPEHKRHFHVLKHTRVMDLLEKTHDIVGTRDFVGHKRIENTMKYVQLLGFHRWEFAERLNSPPSRTSRTP